MARRSPAARTGASTPLPEGGIVVYAGGVPVHVDGALVGAVGMSGGTGEQDEACVLEALSANGLTG